MLFCLACLNAGPTFGKACQTTLVSLAPSLTELAFEAGAGDCLAGVVAYSDWPPEARELPVIGDAFQYDLERIMALAPDRALAWQGGSPPARVAQVEALGIAVTWIGVQTLDDIPRALTTIGQLAGDTEQAETAASDFSVRLAALEAETDATSPVQVFYQVSSQPLFTLGQKHVINDVIARCGGENVFSGIDQEAAAIDFEAVLSADPELMLAGAEPDQTDPLAAWRKFPHIPAVANDQLHSVDPDLLVRPTTRILDGMAWLCEVIATLR